MFSTQEVYDRSQNLVRFDYVPQVAVEFNADPLMEIHDYNTGNYIVYINTTLTTGILSDTLFIKGLIYLLLLQ